MRYTPPSSDDRPMWDLHLSGFALPALTAADELGLFDVLNTAPATATELSDRTRLNERAIRALLPLLASFGLLYQRLGRYHVSETSRNFLLRDSRHYWGPVFALMREMKISHDSVLQAVRAPRAAPRWDQAQTGNPTNAWSEGQISADLAEAIAAYMHANCLPAALVAAERAGLANVKRLLDVGAGSGCFSIAFAQAHPALRCTLMDLQGMCDVALRYAREAEVGDRIEARAVDMFRDAWPREHDAIFFSNIFHDWDIETCAMLARKAHEALPSGGRIVLHEMLLDDTHDGPRTAAAFSFYMLLSTKGQQFTAGMLSELLRGAGFIDVSVTPSHGYFSIVDASTP